jgi:glycosyltransferase 2 family protein
VLKDVAKLGVSAGLVGFLLWQVGFGEVWLRLARIPAWVIAAFVVLLWIQVWIGAVRWGTVAAAIGAPIDARAANRASFAGFFFSQVLPSAYGGDVYRVYATASAGTKIGNALASVLLDRLLGLAGLVLMMLAGLPWLIAIVPAGWLQGIGLVVLLVVLGAAAAAVLGRYGAVQTKGSSLRAVVADAWSAWQAVCTRPRALATAVALAVLVWALSLISTWLLVVGLGLALSPLHVFLLVPPVRLAMAVPVSIAGWGVREGGFIAMLGLVGVPAQDALALGFATGVLTALASLPGAVLWQRS